MNQKIKTNQPQFTPHIKWLLNFLGLRKCDVIVEFSSVEHAFACGYVTSKDTNIRGSFVTPNIIWINERLLEKRNWFHVVNIISHELRHYYQYNHGLFPNTIEDVLLWEKLSKMKKWPKKLTKQYYGHPREIDAVEFQHVSMEKFFNVVFSSNGKYAIN
jgi:hypothetical protein